MRVGFIFTSCFLAILPSAFSQGKGPVVLGSLEEGPASPPVTIRLLKVQPAAEPVPAMKYRLLPELRELSPGNAALLYQRAHSPELWPVRRHPDWEKYWEWLEKPLQEYPRHHVAAIFPTQAMKEIDLAARRENCDWELTPRVRKEGMQLILAEYQAFREYSHFLSFRVRNELLDRQFDQASYTLQTGFAMSRHLADSPTLISSLVGIAIAHIMCERVDEFIQQPGSPNLYWALADLPRPLVSLRKAFQGEKIIIDAHFPNFRQALQDSEFPAIPLPKLREAVGGLSGFLGGSKSEFQFFGALTAARIYPQARKFLIDQGRPPEQVDALPVIQVALMYEIAEFDRFMDDMYKWHGMPYWEAEAGLQKVVQRLKEEKVKKDLVGLPSLAVLLIPAVEKVLMAQARLDRRIAALRCVEAVRLFASHHPGTLPKSLEEIKGVPIPTDPMTGKAFQWRIEKGIGILTSPDPQPDFHTIHYQITLHAGTGKLEKKN